MNKIKKSLIVFFDKFFFLLSELIFELINFNIILLRDLKSFRNKLVILIYVLVFYISSTIREAIVINVSLTLLQVFVAYYFKNRQDSAKLEINKQNKEDIDK